MDTYDLDADRAAISDLEPDQIAEFNDTPLPSPATEDAATQDAPEPEPAPDVIPFDEFFDDWGFYHMLLGGFASSRVGATVDLFTPATDDKGRKAAEAAYRLISKNAMLARLLLRKGNQTLKDASAIFMHGAACVSVVRVAAQEARDNAAPAVFERHPENGEGDE